MKAYYNEHGEIKGYLVNWAGVAELLLALSWVTVFLWGFFLAIGYPLLYYAVKKAPDDWEYSYKKYKWAYNITYVSWVFCWIVILLTEQ